LSFRSISAVPLSSDITQSAFSSFVTSKLTAPALSLQTMSAFVWSLFAASSTGRK
jgi:hypothetical protein